MIRKTQYCWRRRLFLVFCLLAFVSCLMGCAPSWEVALLGPEGNAIPFDRETLKTLQDFAEEVEGKPQVPLERVLYTGGYRLIDQLSVTDVEGARHIFAWGAVADDAWWLKDGRLAIGGDVFAASELEGEVSPLLARVQASITDIAPTVAAALGVPAPAQATGQRLGAPEARYVLLIFLDGFGYVRYTETLLEGDAPYLASLDDPLIALTAYPPGTAVASATLLTGAPPEVHGANQRSIRKTESETLFDVVEAAGLRGVAVEGDALSFNLRHAEVQLSGDRDGNGGTDDNVLANALAVLQTGMPDFFWVHFHGIDDAGHTYGPGAEEERAKIREVDAAVEELIAAVPQQTLIIIFADHGMHVVHEDSERLGNHGHLIDRDMVIPIFVMSK